MQWIAVKILILVEKLYLWAHGWRSLPNGGRHGNYLPPVDYPFERKPDYVRVHAVNAQRQVYAKRTRERNEVST